ncbi:tripartite tricarboxylate transporter permease [Methanocorpusculum bavaricum]|jgi:putative membrane protein|uniref:tripartite tricarboxylate transporter permease n=1 Tax=Methanocorpusculum bavaricum TaxID=71518 RepID=UPI0005B2558D|nr:tripartite tricarboxylate transporter permease [Methanocorpusculum bavaricum]MDD2803180.1 tripartite tricarboxylate transporter permease [Methanocorpusculum sp.]HJJ35326.1 tripartite tricarboxylate transporter permease [Methanocorpusculum sp.]
MLGVVAGFFTGVTLGIIAGFVPGIHSNTLAGLLAACSVPLIVVFGIDGISVMIVSMMVVYTFADILPSTFLGVPDPDTVLSVLPAHNLCLMGNGEEAVRVSALGSLWGFVFCLPLFALFMIFLPSVQEYVDWGVGLVILLAAGLLIVFSKAPSWSFAVFLVSGLLGIYAMRFSYFSFGVFGIGEILLPLLTGLFGIPVLLTSMRALSKPAEQTFSGLMISQGSIIGNGIKGAFAGAIVGWLPGFSSGTANALLAVRRSSEKMDPREYLVSTSAANTANAVLGLAALYALGRMRSGAMVTLASFDLPSVYLLVLAAGAAALAGYLVTVSSSKLSRVIMHLDQKIIARGVLLFLVGMTVIFCGPFGVLILILSTLVGLVPGMADIPRIFCMGAIMLPVMLFTLGILNF